MAMMDLRLAGIADEAAEQARLLRLVLADGQVSPEEMPVLEEVMRGAWRNALEIQDAVVDLKLGMQILRLGRDKAPNGPLAREIEDIDGRKEALDLVETRTEGVLAA